MASTRATIRSGRAKPAKLPRASTTAHPEDAAHRWTFLTNHSHVLVLLARDPTMILRSVAAQVGITERAVQRIIADLERDHYIQRERVGRQNRYRVQTNQPLRHPIEAHRTIGDVLNLLTKI
jgi:hypothetical protein